MAEKKSNFSVTCSLLSQYVKEKRGLAELGAASRPQEPNKGLLRAPPTTLSLLPGVDVSAETETETETETEIETETAETVKSMDLFPQPTGFGFADKKPETQEEPRKAQLTIFYDGQLFVFDKFPADKVTDLMQLAAKGSSAASAAPSAASALAARLPESCPSTSGSKPPPTVTVQAQPTPELPMPIARRASLHRFFAKRKDRINSKAPYQVNENSSPVGSEISHVS